MVLRMHYRRSLTTKLEELKAAWRDAYAAYALYATYVASAWGAYEAELKGQDNG